MRPLRCLLILLIVLLPAGPFATTFPVTKTEDTDDGTCDPDCSLREAIDAANTNAGADDVPVPAGLYLLTLGRLKVLDDVSIAGAGQTTTIIDGNASGRVFDIQSSVVAEISGVAIQNGDGRFSSGGYGGGGIRNAGYLTLTDSTVSGNIFGGIYNFGELSVTNSTVSGNDGGIHNSYGTVTFTNSTVSDNYSGGIYPRYPHVGGGGILVFGRSDLSPVTLTLVNSTVSGNHAYHHANGIRNNGGTIILTNSTVSGNAGFGFGITNSDGAYGGTVTATNTIVADHGAIGGAKNCRSPINSLGYNLTDDTSCGFTATGDLVVADAMLGPLQDNGGPTETHDLLEGSPAIDAGSPDCPPPATDQRGVARPQGAACDIGAVEFVPEPHGSVMLVAGTTLLALLYRRRTRDLEGSVCSGQF